ncbi:MULTISPECIES: isopenicillin N synthase family dioxygenase [Glycomyces]|uniref:Isopenicillin N synthase-like dioxygenase n=2 Tax=Glycomyces TaxID=58113 RepID=A0A9X3SZV6_9ACTN|nr:2OG-Fe(II) oxygenase family protein [Glycomyces lechevalierae]MDA1387811.1 hypothetical protein [Glycomyces lechevalierae]MDR7337444.1 isopenicillin N synthase-like dioxygenase [Glycomyces lechevalierae]
MPPLTGHGGDLPLLDLRALGTAADRTTAAKLVDEAFATGGFLRVVGHAVPQAAIDRIAERSRTFFTSDPAGKDTVQADMSDPLTRGLIRREHHEQFFSSMLTEDGRTVPPEYRDFDRSNRWPRLAGFRQSFADYYREVDVLATTLMRLMATALELPENWFVERFDQGFTPLVANYYPPFPEDGGGERLRHPAHRDWGAMTLLYQDDRHGGLQVRTAEGAWVDVPVAPGSFIVNLGMLMERWTGRRWVAALHRVVALPEDSRSDRISLAFFCQPNLDVLVDRVPSGAGDAASDPVTSGDYYRKLAQVVYGANAA